MELSVVLKIHQLDLSVGFTLFRFLSFRSFIGWNFGFSCG